jgi:hypothetical protein
MAKKLTSKIEKQVVKKQRRENNKLRKWWRNNSYKVWRVLLFWLWMPILLFGIREDKRFKKMQYSDETTKKYLDKVLPYLVSYWREESDCFLMTEAGDMGGINFQALMGLPRRYRKQERYFIKFYQEVKAYIVRTYEIDGYEKFPILTYNDWQAAKEKFDWGSTPYHDDIAKGVVFYK